MQKREAEDEGYIEKERRIKEKALRYMTYGVGVSLIAEAVNQYNVLNDILYICINIYIYIESRNFILLGDGDLGEFLFLDLHWNSFGSEIPSL